MTIRLEDVIASLPPEQQEAIKRRTEELLVEVGAEGSVKTKVELNGIDCEASVEQRDGLVLLAVHVKTDNGNLTVKGGFTPEDARRLGEALVDAGSQG